MRIPGVPARCALPKRWAGQGLEALPPLPALTSSICPAAEADYRHTVTNDASSGGPNPFDVNNFSSLHRGSLDTARAQIDAPYSASGVGSLW